MLDEFEVDEVIYHPPVYPGVSGVGFIRSMADIVSDHQCQNGECHFWAGSNTVDRVSLARKLPGPLSGHAYNWRPGDVVPVFGGVS